MKRGMSMSQMQGVLDQVKLVHHPTLSFRVDGDRLMAGHGVFQPWIQIVDSALPKEYASGRKWRLSPHMTESEVVGTAFAAYKAWLEHEMMESFTYCGVAVFNPHVSIQARIEMASNQANYEYRS